VAGGREVDGAAVPGVASVGTGALERGAGGVAMGGIGAESLVGGGSVVRGPVVVWDVNPTLGSGQKCVESASRACRHGLLRFG
jgi:hypothetical protein